MKRRQFKTLYREFLFRIVDLELLAPQGDITRLLGQFAALLVFISLWLSFAVGAAAGQPELDQGLLVAWAVEHLLIATTMLAVGLFAVLSWDSLFPDRRDVLVLSPLPLRARTIFAAKVAAVVTALAVSVTALNVFTGVFGPMAFASAPVVTPATYDPALPKVDAAGMQAVLDRDLTPALAFGGALAGGSDGGVTVGVLSHGTRRVFAYGTANRDSIYQIGSVSKTFTALILSRMVLQGTVRLDEPVRELLPRGLVGKPRASEITLLDLVTHHSGLPAMPDNLQPSDPGDPFADYLAPNLFAYIGKRGVEKPSKARYLYSNVGVALLGELLAGRAGTTYDDLVQQDVAGPLRLADTTLHPTADQLGRVIRGHRGQRRMRPWNMGALNPAGGIYSTAGDLLTYLDAYLHPQKFPALAAAITQSRVLRSDAPDGARIALAWHFIPNTGIYFHSGAVSGYTSHVFFNPVEDYAAVVLMNDRGAGSYLTGALAEHIRERLEGKPAIHLASPVIPARTRFVGIVRSFAAYWITIIAGSVFIFCCVLSLQGVAQLLPRQAFLRLSSFLHVAFFVLLVMVFFLQPPFSEFGDLAQNQQVLRWLPSFWFFGVFQWLNGPIPPELDFLVRRGWTGLGISLLGAVASYLICYFRTLRKIAEQPDILPSRHSLSLPPLGNARETALGHFAIRTLLRSRQHRVILSFYLGVALGLALFIAKVPVLYRQAGSDLWSVADVQLLVASQLIMIAAVMGTRVAFAMPLEIRANWIFRVLPLPPMFKCVEAARRSLYALAAPVWLALVALLFWLWPWRTAAGHALVLGLLGIIVGELRLYAFYKIPFTCSYQPGKSHFHMAALAAVAAVFLLEKSAAAELAALRHPGLYAALIALLSATAVVCWWRTRRHARSEVLRLDFDDNPEPLILPLGLHRDGVMSVES